MRSALENASAFRRQGLLSDWLRHDDDVRSAQWGPDGVICNVPNGATLILKGGVFDVPVYSYPAITITKPCTLSAIPDRPVVIGN